MSNIKRKIFNKNILIALVTTAILVFLTLATNSTAFGFTGGNTNDQINNNVNYQFGYGEPGEYLPPGTTDIRGAATTSGRFLRDVYAYSEDHNASVHIPSGTIGLDKNLEALTQISITPFEEYIEPPEDGNIIGIPYNFEPSGATFDPPITITFTYDPTQFTGDPSNLKLAIYVQDPVTGEYYWKELTNIHVNPNPPPYTISGDTDEFTVFAIIYYNPVTTTTLAPTQTTTPAQTTAAPTQTTTPPQTTAAPAAPSETNWALIGGLIAAAVVIIVALTGFLLWRRRSA